MNDLKFAFRQLLKHPGFTAVAVLTLALGIGANLALFAILNELLLRPKPVANPDELWAIDGATTTGQPVYGNTCRPYYDAARREARVFKGIIGYADITPKLANKEGAERVLAELVSGDYFDFLGVRPVLGRGFLPEEDARIGTHSVAVLSYTFWQNQFGSSTNALGQTLTLNGKIVEVVGVAPKGFTGLDFLQPRLWLPAGMEKMLDEYTIYHLVGRLADPKLAPAATDLLRPIATAVTKELAGFKDPQWFRYGYSPNFQAFRLDPIGRGSLGVQFNRERILGFLRFAGVATLLLLLIACANVANLFLARGLQRQKEMATRLALGATRTVLMRQLIGEGILVATLGSIGAMLAFSWIGSVIVGFASWWNGPPINPAPDARVLLFAAGSALTVGIGFSLFPALQSTGLEPFSALKGADGTAGATRPRAWLRHSLVVAQIVGSLVLLCGAMLCLRSMTKQLSVDVGFQSDRLVIAPLNLERTGFTTNTVTPGLAEIVRRVSLLPGVEQVGISSEEPLAGWQSRMGVENLEGYKSPDGNPPMIDFAFVGPGVFAALGIPVLYGREINPTDVELGRMVVLVNESFVSKFWPGQEPLGKHIAKDEVIGVVKDARYSRFDQPPPPMMFRMASKESLFAPKLLIRTKWDPRRLLPAVRSELARIHPRLVQGEICTLRDTMKNALAIQLVALRVLAVLGGLALALAVIGTYGVMAYLVTCRTREIGVRIALGAPRRSVMQLILRAGLRLGLVSLAIGLPISLGAAGLLRHLLAGVSPFDPISFVTVVAFILVALIVACYLPARRAARIDPMEALRHE